MPGELPLVNDRCATVAREDEAELQLPLPFLELEFGPKAVANRLRRREW